MCGIVGIVRNDGKPVDEQLLARMNDAIRHRGPDEDGFYVNGSVGLAMRRLAIIDLKSGQQPIHNRDRSSWIVFNGEIYNYLELREKLEKLGHTFYTNSDTEAIVHAYDQFGADCPKHLRGMFAFAIWNERNRNCFSRAIGLVKNRRNLPARPQPLGARRQPRQPAGDALVPPWRGDRADLHDLRDALHAGGLDLGCTGPSIMVLSAYLIPAHVLGLAVVCAVLLVMGSGFSTYVIDLKLRTEFGRPDPSAFVQRQDDRPAEPHRLQRTAGVRRRRGP